MKKHPIGIIREDTRALDRVFFDKNRLINVAEAKLIVSRRMGGNFKNKSYYLDNTVNWTIIIDDKGKQCLVPTEKDHSVLEAYYGPEFIKAIQERSFPKYASGGIVSPSSYDYIYKKSKRSRDNT